MAPTEISADIRRFILTSIPSVPYLEALLLLRGDASPNWNAARLARALYIGEASAQSLLEALLAGGAIQPVQMGSEPAMFRYHPISDDLRAIIDSLAQVHATNLVDVTNLIHARTSRKAQRFADAFVWKKEKES